MECPGPVVQEDPVAAVAEEEVPHLPAGLVAVGVHSAWGSEWSSSAVDGECWAVGLDVRVVLRQQCWYCWSGMAAAAAETV